MIKTENPSHKIFQRGLELLRSNDPDSEELLLQLLQQQTGIQPQSMKLTTNIIPLGTDRKCSGFFSFSQIC